MTLTKLEIILLGISQITQVPTRSSSSKASKTSQHSWKSISVLLLPSRKQQNHRYRQGTIHEAPAEDQTLRKSRPQVRQQRIIPKTPRDHLRYNFYLLSQEQRHLKILRKLPNLLIPSFIFQLTELKILTEMNIVIL